MSLSTHKLPSRRLRGPTSAPDAIDLLEADHRQIEDVFEQFEKARDQDRRRELAEKICLALRVHTAIEEEILYPAYLQATDNGALHHEAIVQHAVVKHLIAEIEAGDVDVDYFRAKVMVLAKLIRQHIKEEEQRGGLFAEARQSDLDLVALGCEMQFRKRELTDPDTVKRELDA